MPAWLRYLCGWLLDVKCLAGWVCRWLPGCSWLPMWLCSRLTQWLGGYKHSLFLVLNSRKFWTEILPGQPQKICRRVKTLALEAIGPGLDSRLQRALLSGASVSGGCLAMSLAGNGWLSLWLASYVADWLSGWFVLWVAAGWLCGFMAVAGWLACYVAAHVAGWLCGSLALELGGCALLAHRRRGWLIAGWAAGCLHG